MGYAHHYIDDVFPQRESQSRLRGDNAISPWLKMQFAQKRDEELRRKREEFDALMTRLRAGTNTKFRV